MTTKVATAIPNRLRHVRDLIVAADPALIRLRMALRASVTVVAGTLLLTLLPGPLHPTTSVRLAGVLIAMLASVVVSDPTRAEEQITTGLLPIVAVVGAGVAAIVGPRPLESTVVFCVVIFVAVFARRWGPRGSAMGTLFFMSYFFALYLQIQRSEFPQVAGSIVVTMAIAFVVRFWIVPERPQHVLHATIRAFRARAAVICDDLAATIAEDRAPRRERRQDRVRRQLVRLNEAALAIDDQIGAAAAASAQAAERVRSYAAMVLEVELGIETLADGFRHLAESDLPPESRTAMATLALSLRCAVWESTTSGGTATVSAPASPDGETRASPWWAHVLWAARLLGASRSWAAPPATGERARGLPGSGGAVTPVQPAAGDKLSPILRLAIQATTAGALAMLAGRLISPDRWYWAVIAAFVVFLRGTTRGEMASRAGQRVIGTIAGVVAGLVMAELVGRDPHVALALVFVGVFAIYYFLWLSYAWTVFFITTVLALLYTVLGRYTPGLLVLRLGETIVGAAIAAGVAAVLFPALTRVKVRSLLTDVLRKAAVAIAVTTARAGSESDSVTGVGETALIRTRELDRALQTLWQATASLTVSNRPPTAPRAAGAPLSVHAVSVIAYCTRHLAWIASAVGRGHWTPADGERGERIAAECAALAGALERDGRAPVGGARLPREHASESEVRTTDDITSVAAWLARIEQMLCGAPRRSAVVAGTADED